MLKVVMVALGGALGSVTRYALGGLLGRMKAGWTFPLETLVINVTGCVLIGLLAGWGEARGVFSPTARAFLFVGALGGYTTFSTFGYESFQLLRDGQWPAALASVAGQVVLGLTGVWAGHALSLSTR